MAWNDFSLPYLTKGIEGIGGTIKETPEDFVVEEIPVYKPAGEGEHLFIHLTKKGITTREVQKALASLYQVSSRDVNFAGIKDKHAVASQYFSVWVKDQENKDLAYQLEEKLPLKINDLSYHRKKIKQGHLLANAFNIKITRPEYPPEQAIEHIRPIIETIHRKGLPNYYGYQRFGIEGNNAQKGYEILMGRRKEPNKWFRRFLLSAYQSNLFNHYLARRIQQGLYEKILKGDVAKKHDTGGIFVVEHADMEQERLTNKEICYTGPIFGKKMKSARDEAGAFEEQILTDHQITWEDLLSARLNGTRRQGIIIPTVQAEKEEDGIRLRFTLPKGAYATSVLREFMKPSHNE
ncbi:MAG: tRNA pseudouridine(13) synthase TruD [Bacteroidales bacterium]